MKVAISTEGDYVSAHFGRCPDYTILEIEDWEVKDKKVIPNPGHEPGFLPKYLSDMGVSCIICGGMGPRAQDLFAEQNIETLIGVQGPIDEVIDAFLKGELVAGDSLCDHEIRGYGIAHGMKKEDK
ncbi:MAG: dinitrogenase iron-molybdenum cofactor [Armatimonadetes bacterium CG07_land_8_20_14_0_80_40_9]|nr:MAG: dinitrogenase iron-molybdenum cofactor [Armatimonadetes bacterium CG07_land_8_20_14_0_80_40_9]